MTWYADHLPGRTVRLDDGEYRYFSGTSYLGMARSEAFMDLLRAGMDRYGANYASSRGGNLQLAVYGEAEDALARFAGAPAALTVSSGMLAGQLVAKALPEGALLLYGPRTHPALWRHPGDNYQAAWQPWADALPDRVAQAPEPEIVILTNALDPLQGERYDFSWVGRLPAGRRITLVVDDSHGLGVTGEGGGGIYRQLRAFPQVRPVVIASLGKALGLPGGVILADETLLDAIRRMAYFGGASPVPPAYLHAFLRAAPLYDAARQRLAANISHFTRLAAPAGLFRYQPDYPVFYTPVNALCDFLREKRILISSFPYPTPDSPHLTRIILSSLHAENDIAYLGNCIE
ncbi:MAG TPA: aminotransferase class I/II-fold pyridoxal phosphate-dependent enzyme, partial [Cytophagales bacterium]